MFPSNNISTPESGTMLTLRFQSMVVDIEPESMNLRGSIPKQLWLCHLRIFLMATGYSILQSVYLWQESKILDEGTPTRFKNIHFMPTSKNTECMHGTGKERVHNRVTRVTSSTQEQQCNILLTWNIIVLPHDYIITSNNLLAVHLLHYLKHL